jgi:hypothetical protein
MMRVSTAAASGAPRKSSTLRATSQKLMCRPPPAPRYCRETTCARARMH